MSLHLLPLVFYVLNIHHVEAWEITSVALPYWRLRRYAFEQLQCRARGSQASTSELQMLPLQPYASLQSCSGIMTQMGSRAAHWKLFLLRRDYVAHTQPTCPNLRSACNHLQPPGHYFVFSHSELARLLMRMMRLTHMDNADGDPMLSFSEARCDILNN